jgi:hypothetical protein
MEHSKGKGDRSVLAIMLALNEAGYDLLVPFGENTRYDLVIDDGSRLSRVQCKTGRLREGAVTFNMCSTYAHHANPRVVRRDYQGEVDYFGVFCVENRRSYLVPIAELSGDKDGCGLTPLETINGDEFDSHQTSKSINVGQNTAPWFARETKGC